MQKNILCKAVLLSYFCFLPVNAYIYHIQVLKKWIPEKGYFQKVHLFSDCHPEGKSQQQCNEILQLLRSLPKRDSLIVVEDRSYYSGLHRGVVRFNRCLDSYLYSEILAGITNICRRHLLNVFNAECRYISGLCRDLVKNYISNKSLDQKQFNWTVDYLHVDFASLEEEYNQIYALIDTYDDPPFNEFYSNILKELSLCFKLLKVDFLLWKQQGNNKEYIDYLIQKFPNSTLFCRYIDLLCFCVDAKALHSLYHAEQKNVYVFMGGAHIKTIHAYLTEIGFELDQYYGFMDRNYSKEETENIVKEKNLSNWIETEQWFWDNARDEPIDSIIFRIFHPKRTGKPYLIPTIFASAAVLSVGGYLLYCNKVAVTKKCSLLLQNLKTTFNI